MAPLLEDDKHPHQELSARRMRRPARADFDAVLGRWQSAVETYRRAVESYQSVLPIRPRPDPLHPRPIPNQRALPHAARPQVSSAPLPQLTRREQEVARLITQGLTNQQIAEALVITTGTAANHVAHVLAKLDATNRTQVAVLVQRRESQG